MKTKKIEEFRLKKKSKISYNCFADFLSCFYLSNFLGNSNNDYGYADEGYLFK